MLNLEDYTLSELRSIAKENNIKKHIEIEKK